MRRLIWTVALAAVSAGAQQVQQEIRVERYAYKGMANGPGPEPVVAGMIGLDGRMGLLSVTGKPFSATETRRTVQMLANGAKIETSDSDQIYRDDQGRTRIEQSVDGKSVTVIMDPVAHYVAILNRVEKTVHKTPIPAEMTSGSVSVAKGKVMVMMEHKVGGPAQRPVAVDPLGDREVNGIMATGTRKVRTIPAGAIGNDRDLQLMDESWFSNDLQLVVKSVSSDPRFGETTYQLTNIVRAAQDPTLFLIPPDYTAGNQLELPRH
ncbi:MAG TPA: hypothetical protein VHW09_19225 [Bryobacteraceae bacterium]|jgi:hypothetical protein|nr:hypothetical protein [Bryobacteraceae bacterium]